MKLYTFLDLQGNELRNAVLQNLAADPSTGKAGQVYFNTTNSVARFYNGTEWTDFGGGTGTNLTFQAPFVVTDNGDGTSTVSMPAADENTDGYMTSAQAAQVQSHEDDLSAATSAPTPDTLIKRDLDGRAEVEAPQTAKQIANKEYVDAIGNGFAGKYDVKLVATVDVQRTQLLTPSIDGVNLATGDRVLLTAQSDAEENGIYQVNALAPWTRVADWQTGDSVSGKIIVVDQGTNNKDTLWLTASNKGADVIGTHDINFVNVGKVTDVVAGLGLQKNGNELSVDIDTKTLEFDGNKLKVHADVLKTKHTGNINLTSTAVNIAHNLGEPFVQVQFFDPSNKPIEVEWSIIDSNTIQASANPDVTAFFNISRT